MNTKTYNFGFKCVKALLSGGAAVKRAVRSTGDAAASMGKGAKQAVAQHRADKCRAASNAEIITKVRSRKAAKKAGSAK